MKSTSVRSFYNAAKKHLTLKGWTVQKGRYQKRNPENPSPCGSLEPAVSFFAKSAAGAWAYFSYDLDSCRPDSFYCRFVRDDKDYTGYFSGATTRNRDFPATDEGIVQAEAALSRDADQFLHTDFLRG
jgi:hypothetical protein